MNPRSVDEDLPQTAVETPAAPPWQRSGRALGWADVAGALGDLKTRPTVEALYGEARFTPDDFPRRPGARAALAEALTRTEDELERNHPQRTREREALRALRRRVEDGVG